MGPPLITFTTSLSFTEKTEGIRSLTSVPTGTLMLQGFSTAPPLIVKDRFISGIPFLKASLIAQTVPTLQIIAPESAGSFPLGISTPKQAETINFSAPCGYFVFKRKTEISSL